MAEEQPATDKTDKEIEYEALKEQYEKIKKENAELKHRVAVIELEKAVPDPDPAKEKKEDTEDSIEALVDEAVARIRPKTDKKE